MTACDIALCYGTRPQVIKASVLRAELGRRHSVLAVDTGQHYDYALNELLYHQLGVARPDRFLEVGSGSHAEQTAGILTRIEPVLARHRPRVAVVIGDTNSTLGCALAAVKLRIPVVHVEAGLRARDTRMAEEINRRVVDCIASLLCTPSAETTRRMQRAHPDAMVVETGDVAYDVLLSRLNHPSAQARDVLGELPDGYLFATLHRAELTDDPPLLLGVLDALERLDRPVILAVHPRTGAALDRRGPRGANGAVRLVPAVGYLQSIALIRGASAIITDSGGLQREAYWLGTPCITVRAETEWTETLDCGANRLVPPAAAGTDLAPALEAHRVRWHSGLRWNRGAYGDGQAAERIAAAVAALMAAGQGD